VSTDGLLDLLADIAEILDDLGISYALGGSMASLAARDRRRCGSTVEPMGGRARMPMGRG